MRTVVKADETGSRFAVVFECRLKEDAVQRDCLAVRFLAMHVNTRGDPCSPGVLSLTLPVAFASFSSPNISIISLPSSRRLLGLLFSRHQWTVGHLCAVRDPTVKGP